MGYLLNLQITVLLVLLNEWGSYISSVQKPCLGYETTYFQTFWYYNLNNFNICSSKVHCNKVKKNMFHYMLMERSKQGEGHSKHLLDNLHVSIYF